MQFELYRLLGQKIVVYDTEIKCPIGENGVTWDDHDRMGISVACVFDYSDGDWKVFLDDNLSQLVHLLNEASLVVGFNTTGFDNRLLRASGLDLKQDEELRNYDMLYHSRRATGWRGSRDPFPKGLKLDEHLKGTFGADFMKTGHGEKAPRLYQEKKMGELISYCLADVRREKALFEHIWTRGTVTTPTHGTLEVHHPSLLLEEKPLDKDE